MSYKTDYGRVAGLGSAKDGTHHFWVQRLSAVALLILTPLFIIPLAYNIGDDFDAVRAAYGHPVNAIIAGLFVFTVFFHLKLGLQVVIEDYIHGKAARTICLLLNNGFCWLMGFTGLFAIAKIAFSA